MLKNYIQRELFAVVAAIAALAVPACGQDAVLDLGNKEWSSKIPGIGPLSNDQIKDWLSKSENHQPLEVKLPLGLSLGQSQMKGLEKNPMTLAKI